MVKSISLFQVLERAARSRVFPDTLKMKKEKQEAFYFQITDIWKKFCEEHNLLFNQTCDEYSLLLGSELEKLDETVALKQETIQRIGVRFW